MSSNPTFRDGLCSSIAITLGYLPVSFSFGLSAVKLGYTPAEAIFFSCVVYAGAGQFVLTALLSGGLSLWLAAFTVMAMDVRHVLYGPALMNRLGAPLRRRRAAVWAFGLTDEVFATSLARVTHSAGRWSDRWMTGLSLGAWLSWVAGTAVGAFMSSGPLDRFPVLEASLSFMLPAMFLTLLLAVFNSRQKAAVLVSILAGVGAILFWTITAGIMAGVLGGAFAGMLFDKEEGGHAD